VSGEREATIPHPGMADTYGCPLEHFANTNTNVFKTYSTLPTVKQANDLSYRSLKNKKKLNMKIPKMYNKNQFNYINKENNLNF